MESRWHESNMFCLKYHERKRTAQFRFLHCTPENKHTPSEHNVHTLAYRSEHRHLFNKAKQAALHKGPGCARPYGVTTISAVLQFLLQSFSRRLHKQFKNTLSGFETATKPPDYCLSGTLFDHAGSVFARRSLFETSSPKKTTLTPQHAPAATLRVVDEQHESCCWDTGRVSLLVICLFFFCFQLLPVVKLCRTADRPQNKQEMWQWHTKRLSRVKSCHCTARVDIHKSPSSRPNICKQADARTSC